MEGTRYPDGLLATWISPLYRLLMNTPTGIVAAALTLLALGAVGIGGEQPAPTHARVEDFTTLPADTTWLVVRRNTATTGVAPKIRDNDLAGLARLKNLRVLDLRASKTRDCRIRVPHMNWSLRLTDAGLGHIAKLTSIERLHLPDRAGISDDGLALLARSLPALTYLSIPYWGGGEDLNDAKLTSLRAFRSMKTLELTGCNGAHAAEWPERIAEIPTLEFLDVRRCPWIQDGGLKPLARNPRLHTLRLARVSDADLRPLEGFPTLTALTLEWCTKLTVLGLEPVCRVASLRVIAIRDCVWVESIAPLGALRNLTSIDLRGCRSMTDDGLAALAKLGSLKTLDLRGCKRITDAGLEHLTGPASVTELDLSGTAISGTFHDAPCAITDAGLLHVAKLRKLRRLNLSGLHYSVSGCARKPIVIDRPTKITDRGIESLSKLPALESLGLAHSPNITDGGLAHLAGLKTLRDLDLRQCPKLTSEGLDRLVQALPDCRIKR